MCCVNYRQKRDKRIVLSSNMIFWEYVTVSLALYNHYIFFPWFCLHFLFFRSFSYEHWEMKLQEWEAFNKQDWGEHWADRASDVWQPFVNCLNDHKSARHEKGPCLEYYYWSFWHVESLCKNGAKLLNHDQ